MWEIYNNFFQSIDHFVQQIEMMCNEDAVKALLRDVEEKEPFLMHIQKRILERVSVSLALHVPKGLCKKSHLHHNWMFIG